jgi:hypothetical protein
MLGNFRLNLLINLRLYTLPSYCLMQAYLYIPLRLFNAHSERLRNFQRTSSQKLKTSRAAGNVSVSFGINSIGLCVSPATRWRRIVEVL